MTNLKNLIKCKKNSKIKHWQNWKTQNVTKLEHSKCEKTQKLKTGQNLKTQNVTTQKINMW